MRAIYIASALVQVLWDVLVRLASSRRRMQETNSSTGAMPHLDLSVTDVTFDEHLRGYKESRSTFSLDFQNAQHPSKLHTRHTSPLTLDQLSSPSSR